MGSGGSKANCNESNDHGELQTLVKDLNTDGKEFMGGKGGLDCFKFCIGYVTSSDEKTLKMIESCTKQIRQAENHEARKAKEILDSVLIMEYFNNSVQTLDLCNSELQKFIQSARVIASCINDGVLGDEKFKDAETKYLQFASEIVTKVDSLRDQHRAMHKKLIEKIKKLDKKLKSARIWGKVLKGMFIGTLTAIFICSVMAAVMAPFAHTGFATALTAIGTTFQSISPAIEVGGHWFISRIKDYESTLEFQRDLLKAMKTGTWDVIEVLGDIKGRVEMVIKKGNHALLFSSANYEGPEDLEVGETRAKLKEFQKDIEDLDKKREECIRVTLNSRNKALQLYATANGK